MLSCFLLGLVHDLCEIGERLRPEPIEFRAEFGESLRVGAVDPSRSLGAIEDEAGRLQRLQVL